MKRVFVAESPAEAHLVAGLLEDAGIRVCVEGEMLFGVRGDVGLTPSSLPSVCVNDEDAERAERVIAESRAAAPADAVDASGDEPHGRARVRGPFVGAVLWLVLAAALASTGLYALLPVVAVLAFTHLLLASRRAS